PLPRCPLFPYTTLFRSRRGVHAALRLPPVQRAAHIRRQGDGAEPAQRGGGVAPSEGLVDYRRAPAFDLDLRPWPPRRPRNRDARSEEHTSELQSLAYLV